MSTASVKATSLAAICVLHLFAGMVFADDGEASLADQQRQHASTPADTSEVLVWLNPGADVERFAREHGLAVRHALRSDPNAYVLIAPSAPAAKAWMHRVRGADARIRACYVNQRTCNVRLGFVPNDPYFHKDTPSPGWPGQWHLLNEFTPGLDARVQGAWNRDATGSGVTIGLVDDCLETTHPDLASNYVAADSWDFGDNDANPDPVYADDQHGVATAGVAAARGGNSIGVTGAAPHAGLAGLRIDFYRQTTQMFVDATLYHSSGTNTNIKIKNHSYGVSYPYIAASAEVSALATSAAAGTIHCLAAGNDRNAAGQDCNTKDLQRSPHGITVAALGSDGKYATYSCFGACVFATAPSGSTTSPIRITTTDRTGENYGYNGVADLFPDPDYTSRLGGTSAAAPVVAGVLALVKQVQPALNGRFAKHLLARTCNVVDAGDTTYTSDGGWRTNAAGFTFNQNYGFGLVDADEMTQIAPLYAGVTPLTTATTGAVTVNTAIPDNNSDGVVRTFNISASTALEEVLVWLNISHGNHGQLEARLTSPSGTTSRLICKNAKDTDANINWTYCTNAFWGENPHGTWTLKVEDTAAGTTGTWYAYDVTARMGSLESAVAPEITQQPAEQKVAVDATATFTVQATGASPLQYRWQKNQTNLYDGGKISGAATPTLQVTNCTAAEIGSYRCVVTNAYGSTTSTPATLTVALVYMVESRSGGQNYDRYVEYAQGQLGDSTAKSTAPGTTAGIGSRYGSLNLEVAKLKWARYSYTAEATGLYEIFATWPSSSNAGNHVEYIVTHAGGSTSVLVDQNNGSNPAGANQWNSLGQYNLTGGTTYTITQTNQNYPDPGFVFRADAVKWTLLNAAGGPTITQQPQPQNLCEGNTATFSVTATGQGTITYQWQKNGGNLSNGGRISGADAATLQITTIDSSDVGSYRCVLTDANGTNRSNLAALTLSPTIVTKHPADQAVPLGSGVALFTVEATGKGTLTYQWQRNQQNLTNGGRISGATTRTLTISNCDFTDAGSYRCLVTGTCGSANSDDADLTVTTGALMFIVESRAGGQNRDRYSEFAALSDSTAKSTATATTPGIGSRFGSMDRAASGIKRSIFSYTAPATGTYEIYVTWPASVNASEQVEHLITNAGGTASVLMDQDSTSNPTGANRWNSLGQYTLNGGTTYTVTQTNENYPDPGEIFRADAVKWEYRPPAAPTVTQHPTAREVCNGGTAVFAVTASGQGTLVYWWQKNGESLSDAGSYSGTRTATLTISPATAAEAGLYRCLVANAGGTVYSNAAALTLKPTVGADFDADCDVDLMDFAAFQSCFNGPNNPAAPECPADADLDNDADVDLMDFAAFQNCFNGPNRPAACQ